MAVAGALSQTGTTGTTGEAALSLRPLITIATPRINAAKSSGYWRILNGRRKAEGTIILRS